MAEIIDTLTAALADRYRIERLLGEGGMATVYLAHDLRHDRNVALKVLRPELGAMIGADRFIQEIKTTAQLQHPHILPLYDSGSTATSSGNGTGLLYYVMPYIQGETLREKLDRERQLGVDDAVKIASEVADALQHAHEQGVIHRDIKPENILLRNGRAIVADFGIALAVSAAGGQRMTQTGMSMGSPLYMSPEQATADKQITNRSDIYSLAAVLYEALTGEPPHTGSSTQAIVLKIVTDVARPVRQLRKSVPPHVDAAIATALEKIPADRFDSAKAFADALHNPAFTSSGATANTIRSAGSTSRGIMLPALASLTLLAILLAAWGWLRPEQTTTVARYQTMLGDSGDVDGMTFGVETAISPDGSSLVFRSPASGTGQLYIKRRDEVVARPLAGTEGGSGPFFSPDGKWIGFVANGQLRRVPSAGGASLKLADSVNATYNKGAWLDDGTIYYYDLPTYSLRRLSAGEATWKAIASPERLGGRAPWLPTPLPDSRGILFTAHLTNCVGAIACRPSKVYVYDAQRDTVRELFDDAIGAWHVPTGHVLYLTSAGTLMAAPWDNESLATSGTPVQIMDGIQAPGFHVSNEGTAYYVLGNRMFAPGPVPNADVVWVDRAGRVEPVDSTWQVNTGGRYLDQTEADWGLALSPDGQRLALTMLTDLGTDIWIKQLPTGPATRLTLDDGVDRAPSWTSDGRAITFLSNRSTSPGAASRADRFSLWEQPADGIGEPRLLWGNDALTDAFRSPNGQWIVLGATSNGTSAQGDILAAQSTERVAQRLVATSYDEQGATLSPDSRWIAYVSNEQGKREVFVRPFPNVNDGKWQVSRGGGSAPVWARSGRELFYVADGKMHVVRIQSGASFSAESPRVLFEIPPNVRRGSPARGTFAMSPDDQRFLMVRDHDWRAPAGTPTLVVVQGFFEELRAKMKQR